MKFRYSYIHTYLIIHILYITVEVWESLFLFYGHEDCKNSIRIYPSQGGIFLITASFGSFLTCVNILFIFPNIEYFRDVKDIITEYEITGDE